MSMVYLGESFDIHTGGVDNVFPHHTNEMAQSEGATGRPFVRFWLHAEHLLVEGAKMSKSLGNYHTIPDLLEIGHRPSAIRYLLLSAHYRTQLNFTLDGLAKADRALDRLEEFARRLREVRAEAEGEAPTTDSASLGDMARRARAEFLAAMDEDLNVSDALSAVFILVRDANRALDRLGRRVAAEEVESALSVLEGFDATFGVLSLRAGESDQTDGGLREWIEERIAARLEARRVRDYERADAIRREVEERGIILEDTPEGTRWKTGSGTISAPGARR